MTKIKIWILVTMVLVLIVPSIVGCAGSAPSVIQDNVAPLTNQVVAMRLGSTVWGMKQALGGAPGTLLMMKDNCIVFGWVVKDAFAFAGVNASTLQGSTTLETAIGGGNLVNAKTMSDIRAFLTETGFKPISADQVPEALRVLLAGATSTLGQFLGGFKTFLVIPAGLLLDEMEIEGYSSWQT